MNSVRILQNANFGALHTVMLLSPAFNKTKIVCTIGPSCSSREKMIQLVEAGMDVCRLNASHGTYAIHQQTIDLIRELNATFDLNLSILLDLQGPKIRIGGLDEPYPIQAGDEVELCTTISKQEGNRLPMELDTLAKDVKVGDLVLVEDGKVELRVLETNGIDTVKLKVINGNEIGSRKGVNLPNTSISLPSLTDKDLRDLQLGIRNHVDWIALSFVRTPEDILVLRQILRDNNCFSRIIAKIEKPEALINIDEIIEVSDAIMVARGDLGVEIPIEEVPFWQKKIVAMCNANAKPVIVATQMLDSMIENARPTRAEATDVANAVFDGADALMLSGETSTGKYPVEAVKTMQRIIAKAEESEKIYHRNYDSDPNSDTFYSDVTCNIAVRFAQEINAKAIISLTQSGYTAFQLSKRRPKAEIFIFTSNRPLLDTLNLVWGVQAYYYDSFEGTNHTIQDVIDILKKDDAVQPGDIVINTASIPIEERGRTNMVKYTVVK